MEDGQETGTQRKRKEIRARVDLSKAKACEWCGKAVEDQGALTGRPAQYCRRDDCVRERAKARQAKRRAALSGHKNR